MFARHWLGFDKWIGTRRSDRTGVDRNELHQDELVPMDICANAQALINISRYRLCNQAAPETREHMEDVKLTIHEATDQQELADVMVPNCIYRCGCPEFHPCKFWRDFVAAHSDVSLSDIRERYKAYNDDFYATHHRN